jgi:hypothetical protein
MESQTSSLTYDVYNEKSFAVRGDKELYQKRIKQIKGSRYNPRLRGGTGWLVPRDKQNELDALIQKINLDNRLKTMQSHAKSRKDQRKYHRAVSDNEYSSDANEPDIEIRHTPEKHEKRRHTPEKHEKRHHTPEKHEKRRHTTEKHEKRRHTTEKREKRRHTPEKRHRYERKSSAERREKRSRRAPSPAKATFETDSDDDIQNMNLKQVFSNKTSPKILNYYKKFSKSPGLSTPESYLSEEDDLSISSNSSDNFELSRQKRSRRSPSPDLRRMNKEMRRMQEKLHKMAKRMRK